MQSFRALKVWEKGHHLTLAIYEASAAFPRDERFGLTSQIRRASSSVPANLAEGCGRGSDQDFARFVQIAMGSASELEYHLQLALDLRFIESTAYHRLIGQVIEIKKMLASLLNKLRTARHHAKQPSPENAEWLTAES